VFFIVVEQILNGLVVGAYYILLALGLSLVFSLGGVVNLAHGAFYALGAYLAVTVANAAGFYGALVVAPLLSRSSAWRSKCCVYAASTRRTRPWVCSSHLGWR
jgi:branched-subunit amino acid ABC-type transport system permease component